MSTLQTNQRNPHGHGARTGAIAVAVGALIAIGISVLTLTLTGANQAIGVAQARPYMPPAAVRAAPAGSVIEPTTDRLRCLSTPRRIAGPSLTTVLFPLAPEERGRVLRIILMTPCHLWAAYAPVK